MSPANRGRENKALSKHPLTAPLFCGEREREREVMLASYCDKCDGAGLYIIYLLLGETLYYVLFLDQFRGVTRPLLLLELHVPR
jgi:hypothetical protein